MATHNNGAYFHKLLDPFAMNGTSTLGPWSLFATQANAALGEST